MITRQRNAYWAPPAWRGIASPGILHASHFHALVEEMGAMGPQAASAGARLSDPMSKAGLANMSVVTEVHEPEQLEELQQFVLSELTRHERLVLMLFYGEGLSVGEIADVLDLPQATVNEIYSTTMEALRAHFS